MVLAWDVHALSNSAEEVFSISVASVGHAHVHCRFQGSYNKMAKLKFSYLICMLYITDLTVIKYCVYLTSVLNEELRDVFCSMYLNNPCKIKIKVTVIQFVSTFHEPKDHSCEVPLG